MEVKKRIRKLKIEALEVPEVYVLGISSHYDTVWIANCINNYLNIEDKLYFAKTLEIIGRNGIIEPHSVFSNYKIILDNDENIKRNFDLSLDDLLNPTESKKTKYSLLKIKGESVNIFPKLKNIEYLLISDYPMENEMKQISQIQEIAFIFEIDAKILGNKFKGLYRKLNF